MWKEIIQCITHLVCIIDLMVEIDFGLISIKVTGKPIGAQLRASTPLRLGVRFSAYAAP